MSCRTDNFKKNLRAAKTVAQAQTVMKKFHKEKDAFDKRREVLLRELKDAESSYNEHVCEDNFFIDDCEARFKQKVGDLTLNETKNGK